MNGKRQTIWLVSMLSLMVVLSAYYLFTEDSGVSAPKETAGSIQVEGKAGATLPSVGDGGVVVNEVVKEGAVITDPDTSKDMGAVATDIEDKTSVDSVAVTDPAVKDKVASDQAAATSEGTKDQGKKTEVKDKAASTTVVKPDTKDDAAILDEVASQSVSASSLFTNYLYEREQKNLKDQNDLLAQVNDMDKTPADNAMAQEQLSKLEEKESKITGIEEQLQLKYGEAIVKEEKDNTYKVVVLSNKLDVKQAVGIVDLVMKELSVTQDKISVQYVTE